MKRSKAQKAALTGILAAQAVALSFLEGLLPTSAFLPPGVKPGFSNIVTMFCAETLGAGYAFGITLIKSLFAFLTRGVTAGFMSLAGGLLSTAVTCVLVKVKSKEIGYIGIAVPSAVCHNGAQLAVCIFITGTPEMVTYAPVLLISALLAGVLTGILLKAIMPVLIKQNNYFSKGVV